MSAPQPLSQVVPASAPVARVPRSADPYVQEHRNAEPGLFVDCAALLANGLPDPPKPDILTRDDGHCLFYRGQTNVLFGDPESGKTWLAFAAVAECLTTGGKALIVDVDHNGAAAILHRLIALGAGAETLRDPARFLLAEPDDEESLLGAVRQAAEWGPTVAVVDSIGEVLPLLGLNSNSPDDYTKAHRIVLLPLARSGAAVLAVDHLAKGSESRAAGPTGTAAKARAVGGVSLRVTLREPFTPRDGGCAALSIRKDRPGGLRAACPPAGRGEQPAGLFRLTPHDGRLSWQVTEPQDTDAEPVRGAFQPRPEDIAEIDSLAEEQRVSVRAVKNALGWGSDKATACLADWRRMRQP